MAVFREFIHFQARSDVDRSVQIGQGNPPHRPISRMTARVYTCTCQLHVSWVHVPRTHSSPSLKPTFLLETRHVHGILQQFFHLKLVVHRTVLHLFPISTFCQDKQHDLQYPCQTNENPRPIAGAGTHRRRTLQSDSDLDVLLLGASTTKQRLEASHKPAESYSAR